MGYLVTAERVPSGIGKKCLKGFSLFFQSPTADREGLPPSVADQSGDSSIRSISEKTHGARTIGSFASLPARRCARGGHQFPRTQKFVIRAPKYAGCKGDKFSHR